MMENVGGKDADLAVINLSGSTAVLPGDTDRILTFFDKAAFIENQHAVRAAKIVI